MKPTLLFWPVQRLSVAFDTARGSARFRWTLREPKLSQGWALFRRGTWHAFWSTGNGWVFQVGKTQWPMDDSYECQNQRVGKHRTFSIMQGETALFSVRYKKLDRDWDVAFDLVDLEEVDFFVWVTCLWNAPERRVRAAKQHAPELLESSRR